MTIRPDGTSSFWRWLWKESGDEPLGRHTGFAIVLGLATGAVSMPLWYWLVGAFSGDILPRPLDPIAGISVAGPGAIMVMVTAGACRPDEMRSWLLTGCMGLLAGAAAQTGMAVALAIAFNVMATQSFGLYALAVGLSFVFFLPAIGISLAASYVLGWRRTLRSNGRGTPPPV